MGSRGYFMTTKWYEIRNVPSQFYWIDVHSCCKQFTKSPKSQCNLVLTNAPLFWYHQIGEKEHVGKSVGKKVWAQHSKLCNTEMWFTFMTTHLITFLFLLRKNRLGLYCMSCNDWYPVITDRTYWLNKVAGQKAFAKIKVV